MAAPRKIEGYIGGSKMRETELQAWIEQVPRTPCTVLEIGTYAGVSSAVVCEERPNCMMLCLDISPAYKEWRKNKRRNQKLFVGTSWDLLSIVGEERFDLIFVDGDHSYSGVFDDLEASKKLIKPLGTIMGHDYSRTLDTVQRAVQDWTRREGTSYTVLAGSVYKIDGV